MRGKIPVKKWSQECIRDITSLGGFAFYWLIIFLFMALMQWNLVIRLLVAFFGTLFLAYIIRVLHFKERPLREHYVNHLEKMEASSFPSLHTMRAAALGVVLASYFVGFWPGLMLGAYVILVGLSRMSLKKHYLIDVAVGLLLGVLIGVLTVRFV